MSGASPRRTYAVGGAPPQPHGRPSQMFLLRTFQGRDRPLGVAAPGLSYTVAVYRTARHGTSDAAYTPASATPARHATARRIPEAPRVPHRHGHTKLYMMRFTALVAAALSSLAVVCAADANAALLVARGCPAACAINCPDCCTNINCPDLCC
ncbi:hypothetical protein GGX14DRAFT_570354 [Mycena pura]|uniref:Uncharacterized protein n=1 Tax=Mycena pura TaxID=153505 RepID=A0AAD6YCY8_9AGAR|nr:hypothetical protein GGX14DRAFT_570354 [Mycena pura]